MNTSSLVELTGDEMMRIEGGDFAYDMGRAIRFLGLSGGGMFAGTAVADWVGTSAMNDALK